MKQTKIIMFDLGGVLVESTGIVALQSLAPHLHDKQVVLERWLRSQAVALFERGRISGDEFAATFIQEWELHLDKNTFLASFASWVRGFYPGALQLIDGLRRQHRVACLSNTNAIHWARMPEAQQIFDYPFASHLSGFMKPDREAYKHALRGMNVAATDVYFFDDLAQNIAAAREIGINAFQVRGLVDTQATLRREKLLYDEHT